MENISAQHDFLVDSGFRSPISHFAYTHDAATGGFDLTSYPHPQNWLQRVHCNPVCGTRKIKDKHTM
jgi:hypothetical protein